VPELDVSLFVDALITSNGNLTIFNLTIFKMVFLCFPVILLRGDRPGGASIIQHPPDPQRAQWGKKMKNHGKLR
jgi:hypothetical protein